MQLDVFQIGLSKRTVFRNEFILAHHFPVGALRNFYRFLCEPIGCQRLAVTEEDLLAGTFHDLYEAKVFIKVKGTA